LYGSSLPAQTQRLLLLMLARAFEGTLGKQLMS
jgi:hypothetical protein